jgi:hypothetical protein
MPRSAGSGMSCGWWGIEAFGFNKRIHALQSLCSLNWQKSTTAYFDKDFLAPTLKYCAFIVALLRGVTSQHSKGTDFSWMWKFFAEPPEDCQKINNLWTTVTEEATSNLKSHCFSIADDPSQDLPSSPRPSPLTSTGRSTPQKYVLLLPMTPLDRQTSSTSSSPGPPPSKMRQVASAEAARRYLLEQLGSDLHKAYAELKEAFNIKDDRDFNMLLVFDEARDLVGTSAIDRKKKIPPDLTLIRIVKLR